MHVKRASLPAYSVVVPEVTAYLYKDRPASRPDTPSCHLTPLQCTAHGSRYEILQSIDILRFTEKQVPMTACVTVCILLPIYSKLLCAGQSTAEVCGTPTDGFIIRKHEDWRIVV